MVKAATCTDGSGGAPSARCPTVAMTVELLLINASMTVGGISTTAEAELGVGGRYYTDTKEVKVRLSIASCMSTNYIRIIPNYYYHLYLFIFYRYISSNQYSVSVDIKIIRVSIAALV